MFTDYYQVREWLESFIPLVYGKEELGLKRIEYLLKLLGNPQRKFKSIHVAGTSGKGSTAFYIARLLEMNAICHLPLAISGKKRKAKSEKRKIGLHISPHLVDIRERMQIIGGIGESEDRRNWRIGRSEELENRKIGEGENLMPMGKFLQLFGQVRPVVEKIQKTKPELMPSYFEILVAASFKYFAEEKVNWAVVEVGLGGRLDATNILKPELTIITNVGLDHTEILGNTVEKIAIEKAGIIKRGVPVITSSNQKALKVIEKVARFKGSKLIKINVQNEINRLMVNPNSHSAILAVSALEELNIPINHKLIKKAFDVYFPGRFEEIDNGVILDGAHNPDKIRSLIEFLRSSHLAIRDSKSEIRKAKGVAIILAFKKGKNWQKVVDLILKQFSIPNYKLQIIATQFQAVTDMGKYQAVDPKEIVKYVSGSKYLVSSIRTIKNSQAAVFDAIQATSNQQPAIILVTGSLYLIGEVRTMWKLPSFE